MLVLGEETLLLVEPKGQPRHVSVHGGSILATAADNDRVVSGGDDGKVMSTNVQGETRTLATDRKTSLDRSHRHRAGQCGRLVGW